MEGAVKIDVPAGQDNRGLYGCLAGNSGEDGEQRCWVRGKVIVCYRQRIVMDGG